MKNLAFLFKFMELFGKMIQLNYHKLEIQN